MNVDDLQPVLFQQLVEGDAAYTRGFRYQVVQVDGDTVLFADKEPGDARERAEHFMIREGLLPVSDEEMEAIRREL